MKNLTIIMTLSLLIFSCTKKDTTPKDILEIVSKLDNIEKDQNGVPKNLAVQLKKDFTKPVAYEIMYNYALGVMNTKNVKNQDSYNDIMINKNIKTLCVYIDIENDMNTQEKNKLLTEKANYIKNNKLLNSMRKLEVFLLNKYDQGLRNKINTDKISYAKILMENCKKD